MKAIAGNIAAGAIAAAAIAIWFSLPQFGRVDARSQAAIFRKSGG
jgi:hypothetical protein